MKKIIPIEEISSHLHFVGFTQTHRYNNAIKVFGKPDFIHPKWDMRAKREISDKDRIVFAEGDEFQRVRTHNATDYIEKEPPYERKT